jgi:hypothetical protein
MQRQFLPSWSESGQLNKVIIGNEYFLMHFLPAGARPVKVRDKTSGLPKPEQSQLSPTNSYPGDITYNCKGHYFMLIGTQYQIF